MKRLLCLLCALAVLVSLAACGQKTEPPAPEAETDPLAAMSLQEVLDASLKDVPDLPDYEPTPLDEETFEFYAFAPWKEGYEGLSADALINATAHSVVLVRVPEDEAESVAKTMRENADPRKWICVEAEKTVVDQSGGTILLVMSAGETANAILRNFKALYGAFPTEEELAIPEPEEPVFEELPEPEGTPVVTAPDPAPEPEAPEPETPVEEPVGTPDAQKPAQNVPAAGSVDTAQQPPAAPVPAPQPSAPAAPEPAQPAPAPAAPEPAQPAPVPAAPETPAGEPAQSEPQAGTDLSAKMAAILAGVENLPALMEWELEPEMFDYTAFLPYAEGYRGWVSEAAVNATPHSVVLLELPDEAAAKSAAETMLADADPRKWICVEAESVQTAAKGRFAILVMSEKATADAIIANFNAQ